MRLDKWIAQQGYAESTSKAQALIMAGQVYVNGQKADKPGMQVRTDADLEVRETLRYVSRGGLKMEGAFAAFPFSAQDIVALDVGASTGGFTDCLLQNGARKVYAVDVGHGQLHYRMQQDERVVNLEKQHICRLEAEQIPDPIQAVVIDTSFISLERVLPAAWTFLQSGGWAVALIKPQFEVGAKFLRKGVVRDDEARQSAVDKICAMAEGLTGAEIVGVCESPIHGPKGNIEFLLGLRKKQRHGRGSGRNE